MLAVARNLRMEKDKDEKLQSQKHEQRNYVSNFIIIVSLLYVSCKPCSMKRKNELNAFSYVYLSFQAGQISKQLLLFIKNLIECWHGLAKWFLIDSQFYIIF